MTISPRRWRKPRSSRGITTTRASVRHTRAAARPASFFQVAEQCRSRRSARLRRALRALPLAIRSGGHGISGRSTNDGGICHQPGEASTRSKCWIRRAAACGLGRGARWMDLAAALAPYWLGAQFRRLRPARRRRWRRGAALAFLARRTWPDHRSSARGGNGAGRWLGRARQRPRERRFVLGIARGGRELRHRHGLRVRGRRAVGEVGWAQLVFDASDPAVFSKSGARRSEAAPRGPDQLPDHGAAAPGRQRRWHR